MSGWRWGETTQECKGSREICPTGFSSRIVDQSFNQPNRIVSQSVIVLSFQFSSKLASSTFPIVGTQIFGLRPTVSFSSSTVEFDPSVLSFLQSPRIVNLTKLVWKRHVTLTPIILAMTFVSMIGKCTSSGTRHGNVFEVLAHIISAKRISA